MSCSSRGRSKGPYLGLESIISGVAVVTTEGSEDNLHQNVGRFDGENLRIGWTRNATFGVKGVFSWPPGKENVRYLDHKLYRTRK